MTLHHEKPEPSRPHRAAMLREVKDLVRRERRKADGRRTRAFRPPTGSMAEYEAWSAQRREDFRAMLGWPLTEPPAEEPPKAKIEMVAQDELGRIFRVWIDTLPGVRTYGLLYLPRGKGPFPLAISQHGGGGTPELCTLHENTENYNDMTRRAVRRGIAAFAPQLLLWRQEFKPAHDKLLIDRRLKQLGGSLAALEIYRLQRALDYLVSRPDIDGARVGILGLSYGGFYALYGAAADARFKVALSSCFFNSRKLYDFHDWSWRDSANRFLDAEVAALVCPRPLYIELGLHDELFAARHARPEGRKVTALYEKLGIPERFVYHEHGGGHEFDRADAGLDFFQAHL